MILIMVRRMTAMIMVMIRMKMKMMAMIMVMMRMKMNMMSMFNAGRAGPITTFENNQSTASL